GSPSEHEILATEIFIRFSRCHSERSEESQINFCSDCRNRSKSEMFRSAQHDTPFVESKWFAVQTTQSLCGNRPAVSEELSLRNHVGYFRWNHLLPSGVPG